MVAADLKRDLLCMPVLKLRERLSRMYMKPPQGGFFTAYLRL